MQHLNRPVIKEIELVVVIVIVIKASHNEKPSPYNFTTEHYQTVKKELIPFFTNVQKNKRGRNTS